MVRKKLAKNTCCHKKLTSSEAAVILRENGLSSTTVKRELLVLLSQADNPLNAHELCHLLDCNPSTVFRGLKQLREKELITELSFKENGLRYEYREKKLSEDQHFHHHHHIRCVSCHAVKKLTGCVGDQLKAEVKALGFINVEHIVEFSGICKECSA